MLNAGNVNRGSTTMPVYEYVCEKCNHSFSVKMSMAEHGQKTVKCPACKGKKVIPHFSTFYVKTSKKS
jgi:putative FmdB family regulatory protein